MKSKLLHAFADPAKPEEDFIRVVRAEGATLFDARGNAYVDAIASLWYCQVGHGRREIIDAINAQLERLVVYNTFDPFTNEPALRLAELVAGRVPIPDARVFLASSGSEAIDTAIKLVRATMQRRGEPRRQLVVRRARGYHGTNLGGTSAQGIPPNREGWGELAPNFDEAKGDDIDAFRALFEREGERIAAVLTEPVQGAGGVHPPPEGLLPELRRLCDEHGALLVFDEVITGFGRCGEWFGAQHFGVTPDVMTFAKGVTSGYQPLSGVVVSGEVAATLEGQMLRTGYTYSGHPTACAAGIANLELIESEGLVERARSVGAGIRERLAALQQRERVESIRGVGAIWAAELGREALPVRDRMLELGVVARPIGTAIAFCPPLVVRDAELDRVFDALDSALG